MNVKQSVVTPVCFPRSRYHFEDFCETIEFLSRKGIHHIEFYYEGEKREQIYAELQKRDMKACYIAVIPLKENNLSLCSLDNIERTAAINLVKVCMDDAYLHGCHRILVNSGKAPAGPQNNDKCRSAFIDSIIQLSEYAEQAGSYGMEISLEPCDSAMQAKNLAGSTSFSIDLCKALCGQGHPFALTMDIAHIVEEDEPVLPSLTEASIAGCDHIHFANCIIKDPANPLYGDQHPGFDYENAEFTFEQLEELFNELKPLYLDRELWLSVEYLCRNDDPYVYFEYHMSKMPWLFG